MTQAADNDDNGNGISTGAFFTGLLAGAVIGAGLGLWFAPKAGAEMREQITGKARDVNQRVGATLNELTDRSRDALNRARDVLNTAGDQIQQIASLASGTTSRRPNSETRAGERL